MQEQHRVGIDYLKDATTLLQHIRSIHPTKCLYEAADLCWWWRSPRVTDELPQLFWFDNLGRPQAAVIATEWGNRIALDPIVMPDANPKWVVHIVERGLAHACECGLNDVEIMVAVDDDVMRDVLTDQNFAIKQNGYADVESWISANARSAINALPDGYRLGNRLSMSQRPHHMIDRNGPEIEKRLRQTSLYRPELDLVVLDYRDEIAAYGLFWLHSQTTTGLVEPLRAEDEHQRKGLARHLLTTGIDLLADAGATRIKIVFEPGNAASSELYLSVGFKPVKQTVVYCRKVVLP